MKTGKHYRLPTEAEWEYAYRAGTNSMTYWGDDFKKTCDYANFADRNSGYQAGMAASCTKKIHPNWTTAVGSYQPNPWGLYDMAGNAQETVEDCFHDSYSGAPASLLCEKVPGHHDHTRGFQVVPLSSPLVIGTILSMSAACSIALTATGRAHAFDSLLGRLLIWWCSAVIRMIFVLLIFVVIACYVATLWGVDSWRVLAIAVRR